MRYSIGTLLRFWLARLSYEQQAQTDRLVAAGSGAPPRPAAPPARRLRPPPRRRRHRARAWRRRPTSTSLVPRLAIVGAGGHGREVLDVVEAIDREAPTYEVVGVVADHADVELLARRGAAHLGSVDDLAAGRIAAVDR